MHKAGTRVSRAPKRSRPTEVLAEELTPNVLGHRREDEMGFFRDIPGLPQEQETMLEALLFKCFVEGSVGLASHISWQAAWLLTFRLCTAERESHVYR